MVLYACHLILHFQFHYPHIKICHIPTLTSYLLKYRMCNCVITEKSDLKD
jgi:hypothetical protein